MIALPPWPKPHPDYGMDWRAHSDAALARQAFRDWLDGTPEQWQAFADRAYDGGYDEGEDAKT